MKKVVLTIIIVAILVAVGSLIYLGVNKNNYEFHARVEHYITLEPIDLIGTEYGNKILAKVRYYPEKGEDMTWPGEPDEWSRNGTYRYGYYDWENKEYQKIFEPVYGTGCWIFTPADY